MVDLTLVDALIDGRYRVKKKLGAGGMGVVWLAYQQSLEREVAVKTLASDDKELVERFQREGRALSRVRHENVVVVFDSGKFLHEGHSVLYIAMELVEGETLRQLLGHGALSVDEGVRVLRQILRGLEAAHAVGVVHRDVKPENAMFDRGVLKLMDFGIARVLDNDAALTKTGGFVGTPGYTAPEVALGQTAGDAASDLYAVGAIAFEIFAGAPVFMAQNGLALAMMHASAPAPRLSSVARVPLALDDVVARLLSKNPKVRPTATECLLALPAVETKGTPRGNRVVTQPRAVTVSSPSSPSSPSLPPDAATEASNVVGGFHNDWLSVEVDDAHAVVIVRRNAKRLAIDEIEHAFEPLLVEPRVERARYAFLFDVRLAPPNGSDEFGQHMDPMMQRITSPYREFAVLVKSATGRLHVARVAKNLEHDARIFGDEAEALAALVKR